MATLTVTKNYADDTVLYESDLDDMKSSIETFVNSTKLGSSNIAALAIAEDKLQASAVTAAKIASSAVTAVKIQDGSVTRAKLAAVGQQLSSSCGASVAVTGTTYTDITNLTVTITTSGRPVFIMLQPEITGDSSIYCDRTNSGKQLADYIKILKDSADLHVVEVLQTYGRSGSTMKMSVPISSVMFLDAPAAGTYTYKIQAKGTTANERITFSHIKLLAYEI